MRGVKDAQYRIRLAEGFLVEARQDVDLARWRSSVDNAQLASENAAKAVLALVEPVGRTHSPAVELRRVLGSGAFESSQAGAVKQLVERAEMLGSDIHVQTDYGDESGGRTPWELFGEVDARQAVGIAEEVVNLAQSTVLYIGSKNADPSAHP